MTKRMLVWTLAFAFALAMVSFTVAQDKPKVPAWQTTVVKDWVAKAKAEIKKVTPADVKAAIDKQEKAFILDVRDPEEYKAGHLPGAINVSRGKLEFTIWDRIPDKEAKIYVYCLTAARSALATKTLNELGYKNAVLMDAHFEDWVKAGYPVSR
ncbi:MAG: rhodanese-like domain-containing protein [Desulfobacterota bacterium]|nr:rhodanese-like domain-containing protein [Thermodesulfobacteriota bacterium]